MEKVMQLKTIKEYNDYMGVETRHPLVSVIEGSRMPHPVPHARKHVGMYVIFLKELRCTDDLTYGRRSYDFQENTLLFIAPGQVFGHEADVSSSIFVKQSMMVCCSCLDRCNASLAAYEKNV